MYEYPKGNPFPDKRYRTVVIDPPWPVTDNNIRTGVPYETMDVTAIEFFIEEAMNQLTEKDCNVFIWFTNSMMIHLGRICKSCQLKYKTTITWCKNYGLGRPPYSATEHLIYFTRGFPPRPHIKGDNRPLSWIATTHKPKHSEKPDEMYQLIERLSQGPYIDLFARKERKGWDVWGNEIQPITNTMTNENCDIPFIKEKDQESMMDVASPPELTYREKAIASLAKNAFRGEIITVPKLPIEDNPPALFKGETILADVIEVQEEGKEVIKPKRVTSVPEVQGPERKIALEYLNIESLQRKAAKIKDQIKESQKKIKKLKRIQKELDEM